MRLDATTARTAPHAASFLDLPTGFTHYEAGGPPGGAPVLLVHGLTTPMFAWDAVFDALTQAGCRVVRYDQYGRGWSERRPDAHFDVLLDQLGAVLDHTLPDRPVTLAAWSWGCGLAAAFAARHPDRLDRVVLVAPGGVGPGFRATFSALRTKYLGEALVATVGPRALAADLRRCFVHPERHTAYQARFDEQLRYDDYGAALLGVLRGAPPDFRLDYAALGATRLPVAALWGARDVKTPSADADILRRLIPAVECSFLPGVGHAAPVEAPGAVSHAILPAG